MEGSVMAGEVTPNMSLALVPTSNFVTPEDFNRNFEKLDALGLDYVTEFGTSGEWWFRKWKSGRAECGIDYKEFGQKTLIPWGNTSLFGTELMSFGPYPFAFSARPFTIISFENDKLLTGRACWVNHANSTSTSLSPNFSMIDASSGATSPCCGIYVSGRYK